MRVAILALLAACGDGMTTPTDGMPDAQAGVYSAHVVIGGLDRIVIAKRTDTTCFGITLRSPANAEPDLTLPANWQREWSYARQPATACEPPFETPTNMFASTAQLGTVTWQGDTLPTSISSIDVTLTFTGAPSWCPPSVQLTATAIPVD